MNNFTWKTVMNYRNLIYGLAAVWILIYHVHNQLWLSIPVVSKIIGTGNMAVDVFLILSAVGLSYSVEKNNLKTFYTNRLKRTFITYLLIATPFFVWKYFIAQVATIQSVPNFILDLSSISYFWTKEGVFPFWYVPCILLFYAFYPFLYRLYKKNKLYIVGLIVLSVIAEVTLMLIDSPILMVTERTFSRIPVFLAGILISDSVKNEKRIPTAWIACSFAILTITLVIYPVIDLYQYNTVCVRYIYGIMSFSLLTAGVFVMECVKKIKITDVFVKVFSFLGEFSLEIYLVHAVIIKIMLHYGVQNKIHIGIFYISVLIGGIAFAIVFNRVAHRIINPKKANI